MNLQSGKPTGLHLYQKNFSSNILTKEQVMKTYKCFSYCFIYVVVLVLNGCEPSKQGPAPYIQPVTQMAEIGPSGGNIVLSDSAGNTIEMSIPYGALDDTINITMTSLGEKIKNPVSNNVFRGLSIEPEDLLLNEPATIRFTFPSSIQDINKICAYSIMSDDYVIPLADQASGSHSIEGKIYFFKKYAAGTPSEEEIVDQIARLKKRKLSGNARLNIIQSTCAGSCPPIGYGWEGTYTTIHGLIYWYSKQALLLGDDYTEKAMDEAREILNQDIESFLALDIPDSPCGNYAKAAGKYLEAAILLRSETGPSHNESVLYDRFWSLVDQCAYRFNIEIDREIKSEGNEKEHQKAYGVVSCSIPFDDFSDAEATTSGQGVLSYNYTYEWLYNEAMNYKSTANASGTIDVTCDGYTEVIYTPQGEAQIWLRANLHFKEEISGTSCDTANKEHPCTDTESHAEWNERVDFLFQNGYTVGGQVDTKDGYVRDKMTLFIISMNDGGHDSDSGICY